MWGQPGSDRRDQIQALLDERAEAVLVGDEQAFMATIATRSKDFRRRQRRSFRRLIGIGLSRYELEADWGALGDLARPSDLERYPDADEVALPVTVERLRIRRFDARDAIAESFFTFVQQDGRWLIASDDDLDDVGLKSERHLWDLGAVEQIESDHFRVYQHPCTPSECLGSDFLDLAEQALRRVGRFWPIDDVRVVILVPGDGDRLARMLQASFDPTNFVAFAVSNTDPESGKFTGARIVFNRLSFGGRSPASIIEIMAHELLHVVTRSAAGPFVPNFVEEGFADYVGRSGQPISLAALRDDFDGVLPRDFEFTTGDGSSILRTYRESDSAVRYLIDRWGLGGFKRFYRNLGSRRRVPGTSRFHLGRALKRTIGIGLARFQSAWADSITG